jgi:hypothetical protein
MGTLEPLGVPSGESPACGDRLQARIPVIEQPRHVRATTTAHCVNKCRASFDAVGLAVGEDAPAPALLDEGEANHAPDVTVPRVSTPATVSSMLIGLLDNGPPVRSLNA